jgi:hypothetical protein
MEEAKASTERAKISEILSPSVEIEAKKLKRGQQRPQKEKEWLMC